MIVEKNVVEEIVAEALPIFAKHGVKAGDAESLVYDLCRAVGAYPEGATDQIRTYLRNLPLSVYLKNKDAIKNLCRQAAEDLRLLIESGEGASHETGQ